MTLMQWGEPAGVRERWQKELDLLAPRTPAGPSHLRLLWEPGEAWAPVGRWVIWECVPAHRAPLGIYEELLGPNPRHFGHYDRVQRRFVRTRSFNITMRQWLFYRETGFCGRCLWVVQGSRGGHKRFWSQIEANLSRFMRGPSEPPTPGALPYAEPDQRTIAALRGLDHVRLFGSTLHMLSNKEAVRAKLDYIERLKAEEMGRQLWKWMDDQIGGALEITRAQAAEIWSGGDPDAPEPDVEKGKEEFVQEIARTAMH